MHIFWSKNTYGIMTKGLKIDNFNVNMDTLCNGC
jgi:hypothetical protein